MHKLGNLPVARLESIPIHFHVRDTHFAEIDVGIVDLDIPLVVGLEVMILFTVPVTIPQFKFVSTKGNWEVPLVLKKEYLMLNGVIRSFIRIQSSKRCIIISFTQSLKDCMEYSREQMTRKATLMTYRSSEASKRNVTSAKCSLQLHIDVAYLFPRNTSCSTEFFVCI